MINPDWKQGLPSDFSEDGKVWVYQSNRIFSEEEKEIIGQRLDHYTRNWISHNRPVKGWGSLFFNQFIVLMADDTMDRLCGSAVDNSIRFIKELELKFGLELINRMNLGFVKDDILLVVNLHDVQQKVAEGSITGETLFFNNAITTKRQLVDHWIRPFKESFFWKRVANKAIV